MNYIKETLKYIFKTFFPLAAILILPAVVLGVFVKPMSSISFIPDYAVTGVESYSDVFRLVFRASHIKNVYPPVLIFLSLFLGMCFGFSFIEKHFRTGRKILFQNPVAGINETFFPVLTVLMICTLLMVLYSLILISVVYLLHIILSGDGLPSVLNIIVSTFVSISIFILFIALTGPVIFMIPLKMTYGYAFSDAFSSAFAIMGKKAFKIIFSGVFPFLLVAIIEYVLTFFTLYDFITIIISICMYLFIIMYVISYVMIVMFDVSGLERRDIKQTFGSNKGK